MMMGTGARARMRWQSSTPDWSGSMTSSRTMSGWTRWNRRSASWPSAADLDREPLAGQARGQGLAVGLLVVDHQHQGPVVAAVAVRRPGRSTPVRAIRRTRRGTGASRRGACTERPAGPAGDGRRRRGVARRPPGAPAGETLAGPAPSGAGTAGRRADGRPRPGRPGRRRPAAGGARHRRAPVRSVAHRSRHRPITAREPR